MRRERKSGLPRAFPPRVLAAVPPRLPNLRAPRARGRAALLPALIAIAGVSPAQSIGQTTLTIANQAVSAIEVFSASDSVATGSFRYDNDGTPDALFSTYRLPLRRYFAESDAAFRPFLFGSIGYFKMTQEQRVGATRLGELREECFTTALGAGADWAAADWLTLTPRLPVSYAFARQRFEPDGGPGGAAAALFPDWQSHVLALTPSLELKTRRRTGAFEYGVGTRGTYVRAKGIADDSDFQDIHTESVVWRTEVYARHYTPWSVQGCPVVLSSAFARHDLFGDMRHADFLNHFYEVRAGVGFHTAEALGSVRSLSWLHQVELSAAYYFGERFSGVSVGISSDF